MKRLRLLELQAPLEDYLSMHLRKLTRRKGEAVDRRYPGSSCCVGVQPVAVTKTANIAGTVTRIERIAAPLGY